MNTFEVLVMIHSCVGSFTGTASAMGLSEKWNHLIACSYNNQYNSRNHITEGKEWVRVALGRWLPYLSDKPYTVQDSGNGNAMKKKSKSTIKYGSAENDKRPAAHSARGG